MITLSEIISISDSVVTNKPSVDISISVILFFTSITLGMVIRYSKFVKTYYFKRRTVTLPSTPYEAFDFETLLGIADKLSKNLSILITIYGFLFVFIISQNFQHVTYSWPVIIWSGWVLAIIVRTANIALNLTDVMEIAKVNDTIKTAANTIYAYNRYFRHTTFLLVFAVAFSPAVFLPLNESHRNDYELWNPQISIATIALGIIGVSFTVYYFARVNDLIKFIGIPDIYYMSIFILAIEPLSYLSAAPLSLLNVTLLGYTFLMPQLLQVVLTTGTYLLTFGGLIMLSALNNYMKEKRQKRQN